MTRALATVVSLGLAVGMMAAATAAETKTKMKTGIPAAAKGFAGMVQGKVFAAKNNELVLTVEKVTQSWKHSKAKDAESLVGQTVLVVPNAKEGKPVENVVRFINGLKVGESVTIDVNNLQPKSLTLMELTEQQRAKVKGTK